MVREIPIKSITILPQFQIRAAKELDAEAVRDYAIAYTDDAKMPPIDVFENAASGSIWVVDGFHRLKACQGLEYQTIACEVHEGTAEDALRWALEHANVGNGMRYTTADKRRRVGLFLQDAIWVAKSDAVIAKAAGVDPKTVAKIRKDLQLEGPEKRVGADGRQVAAKKPRKNEGSYREFPDKNPVQSDENSEAQRVVPGEAPCSCTHDCPACDTKDDIQRDDTIGNLQSELEVLRGQLADASAAKASLESELLSGRDTTARLQVKDDIINELRASLGITQAELESLKASAQADLESELQAQRDVLEARLTEVLAEKAADDVAYQHDQEVLEKEVAELKALQLDSEPVDPEFAVLEAFGEAPPKVEPAPTTFLDAVLLTQKLVNKDVEWTKEEFTAFHTLAVEVKDLYSAAKKQWTPKKEG